MPRAAAAACALAKSREATPATSSILLFSMPGMTLSVPIRAVDRMPHRTGVIALSGRAQSLVDAVFELAVKLDHLRIDERKALSQDHAGHLLAWIEPEVCVGKTRPGKASGGAPGWPLLRIDEKTQAPLQVLIREHLRQLYVERCARRRRLPDAGHVDIADLILRHQRHCFRAKQLG